jgi:Protein of unknown function (DUF2785)
MGGVQGEYWRRVLESGAEVPSGRRLGDLTQELFEMLGDPDPAVRDEVAYAVLARWISDGVYDDLLTGLADGAAAGLRYRLGSDGDDSVFRRSLSALILAEAIRRDNITGRTHPDKVLSWGDRATGWFTRERDLRGYVPGKGWANTVAHGGDLIGAFARSPHFGLQELTVLLDVVADRLLAPTAHRLVDGQPDRLAYAVMAILHRNVVPQKLLDPWVARLAADLVPGGDPKAPRTAAAFNTECFLRSLHLQLATGVKPQRPDDEAMFDDPPAVRADLILTTVGALRSSAPWLYR